MKLFFLNFSFLLLLLSCNRTEDKSFTLDGEIKGDYQSYIYIKYDNQIDSTLVKNSRFHFEGQVNHPTESFLFPGSPASKDQMGIAAFMLENANIDINLKFGTTNYNGYEIKMFDIDSVSGSNAHRIQKEFEAELLNTFHKEEESTKVILLYPLLDKFVSNNPKSELAGKYVAELNGFYGYLNAMQLETLLEKMDSSYQKQKHLSKIKSMISQRKILAFGSKIPKIELPNQEGAIISAESYKGKIVLLEFWASWCAPCRNANPQLIKVYQEFPREEFEILGISIDQDETAWKKAIEEDNLIWTQTIDSLNTSQSKFKISTIPFNILLDKEGKILATELKPNELREILKSKI